MMRTIARALIVTSIISLAGGLVTRYHSASVRRLEVGHTGAEALGSEAAVGPDATEHGALVGARTADTAKRTALLIGINHAAGGSSLYGAVADAENMYAALRAYGFAAKDITVLTEGQATRARILSELASLAKRTAPDGVAVFSFAGHSGRSGGMASLRAADGGRVPATVLARALGQIRGRVWSALPTCYSAAYSLPGIVGAGRIATFASPANTASYEVGTLGSYLIHYMVRVGMVEKHAPSVEDAFAYARAAIARDYPDRVPSISDGIPGHLQLGPVARPQASRPATQPPTAPQPGDDSATDTPKTGSLSVCGVLGCR